MPYASRKAALFAATLLATFTFAVQRASSATTIFADLTGDGIAETITGQPTGLGSTVNSGRVIVYDGVTSAALLFIAGESSGDEFGASVALLHDQNHDGLPELAVGAPGSADNGAAYVFRSPMPSEYAWISAESAEFELHAPDLEASLGADRVLVRFGESVAAFYDMDNDGASEFRVGCFEINTTTGSIRHAAGIFEGQIGVQIAHAVVTVDALSQFTDPFAGLRCDVAKDGTVSIEDVLAVVAQLGSEDFVEADIDGDGMVTAVDLLAVALDVGRQSLGMIADEPREVGDSVFGTWTRSIERDDGVNATAETIGNGIVSASWMLSDGLPSPAVPHAVGPCMNNLSECYTPDVREAIDAMNAACTAMPANFEVKFICLRFPDNPDNDDVGQTLVNCRRRTIRVWIKPGQSIEERCGVVAHELWHVAQACALGFFADPLDCQAFDDRWFRRDRVCMEWFAYHETGDFDNAEDFCAHYCEFAPNKPTCLAHCVPMVPRGITPGVLDEP